MEIKVSDKIFILNDNYKKIKNCLIHNCIKYNSELIFDRDPHIFELFILPIMNGDEIKIKEIEKTLYEKYDYNINHITNYIEKVKEEYEYFGIHIYKQNENTFSYIINAKLIAKLIAKLYNIYVSILEMIVDIKIYNKKNIILNNKNYDIDDNIIKKTLSNIEITNININNFKICVNYTFAEETTNNSIFLYYIASNISDDEEYLLIENDKIEIKKEELAILEDWTDKISKYKIGEIEKQMNITLDQVLKISKKYKFPKIFMIESLNYNLTQIIEECKKTHEFDVKNRYGELDISVNHEIIIIEIED